MPERAQIAFLHRVLGITSVAEQVSGQGVDVVEIGQRGVAKPPRLVLVRIAAVTLHRVVPCLPG